MIRRLRAQSYARDGRGGGAELATGRGGATLAHQTGARDFRARRDVVVAMPFYATQARDVATTTVVADSPPAA